MDDEAGRWPRWVAYPLIGVVSVLIWYGIWRLFHHGVL